MKTKLWQAQQTAFNFLKQHQHPALLMDMGTGKTRISLELFEYWQAKSIVIVCPLSVIPVWGEEITKHGLQGYTLLELGQDKTTAKKVEQLCTGINMFNNTDTPIIVVINFESVWRKQFKNVFLGTSWDVVLVDESHRIKAPGSTVSKFMTTLSRRAKHRVILTGTPIANNPLDIYAQYRFLDPTIFAMNNTQFKQHYALWGGFENRQPIKFINQDELKAKMYSVAYRMSIDDVLDLPDGIDAVRYTQLEPKAKKLYNTLKRDFVAVEGGQIISASNVLVKGLRLHQLTGGMIKYDDGSSEVVSTAKAKLLQDTLYDMTELDVVVFARFRHDIDVIRAAATKLNFKVYELSGKVNQLKQWEQSGGLLIVQIASGNAGISLVRANHAIYYSIGYSLGEYMQSRARLRRPGQSKQVQFIHLIVKGTIDELIIKAIQSKQDIANYIVEHQEQI